MPYIIGAGVLGLATIAAFVGTFFTVEQRPAMVMVQWPGNLVREAGPDIHDRDRR